MRKKRRPVLCMVVVLCVMLAFAISARAEIAHGIYYSNAWTLDDSGTLTISMSNKSGYDGWSTYQNQIINAIINSDVTEIRKCAFMGCGSLKSVKIPDKITRISESAFHYCSSLTSVNIPDSVTIIDNNAFENCTSLASIDIPSNVTKIGERAFFYCPSLTSVTVPEGVTVIENCAFCNCFGLKSITLPDTVTSLEFGALQGCTSLSSVTLPKGVITIGKTALLGCTSLTSVTIPDTVTVIGDSAFAECTALKSIKIPGSVTVIGDYAFACSGLTSATIPDSVTSIGTGAFMECDSLKLVTIPNSVVSIGSEAFPKATVIDCAKDSYAYQWAKKEGYRWNGPEIVDQPANVSAVDGTNAQFTVRATGNGLAYQWQYRKAATGTWSNSPATGNTEDTLTVPVTASRNGYQYHCVITDKDGKTVTTAAATLTVQTPLKITTQPANATAADGTNMTFTVKATGDGLTYQWKYRKSATSVWANSPATGSTTATVTVVAAVSKNGYQYECVIKDKYGNTVTTTAVTLTVQTPLKITTQPADVTVTDGANATFTVKATGDGLTYQWKYRKSSAGSWANSPATGNTTATVTIASAVSKNGYQYECVIKDKYGNTVTTTVATLTVQAALKITTQPVNVTAARGANATFTIKATGDGLTYQWKYRTSSTGSWANSPATGNTTATVTIAAAASKNGYQYECVIKDKYGKSVTSSAATLTVQTPLKITAQPVNATVTAGANATFMVKATGDGLTYQWKYRTSSTGSWTNSPATGNTTATVTIAAAASKNGYQYECVIKDKYGKSVTSSVATLTVNPEIVLKITAQPQNKTVTVGTEAKFTVKVTGEGLKYQWQYRKNADSVWTNTTATGCKTATLTLPGTASRNGYQYHCVITDKNGKKVTSNTITLTVQ